jgi:hypothetical protein
MPVPLIEAQGTPPNHFLRLGMIHPLGGGKHVLDSIIVVDTVGRCRLVLPIGWGMGKHIADPVAGPLVLLQFRKAVRRAVERLEVERAQS